MHVRSTLIRHCIRHRLAAVLLFDKRPTDRRLFDAKSVIINGCARRYFRTSFPQEAQTPSDRVLPQGSMDPSIQEAVLGNMQVDALHIQQTAQPKPKLPEKDLVFGKSFTDHMLLCEWDEGGWQAPRIVPYGPIALEPSCTVFHYGMECFEGMKAYKDRNGATRLFRPEANMKRLKASSERLMLPTFNTEHLLSLIKELVKVDEDWIPQQKGYSLYIRPTFVGTGAALGVGPANRALLFVICSPVGPYWKQGFSAISLLGTYNFARAWPGGVGDCKVGGNYAPAIRPQIEANRQGHAQNLWLTADGHYLTEVGTMNLFLFLQKPDGKRELVTPPLDGMILPGITRDSILQLARQWNRFEVSERPIQMQEVVAAQREGRLLEVFGAGTACVVTPVKNIAYNGEHFAVPLDPTDPKAQAGPLTKEFETAITAIQYGDVADHPWSHVIQ